MVLVSAAIVIAYAALLPQDSLPSSAPALGAVLLASTLSSIAGFAFSAICGVMLLHMMSDPLQVVETMRRSAMDEIDEDELFTVCLDDDGHPVQRVVRDMTAGEVIAAIDHLTVGSTRIEEREKLARLRQVVAQKHPRPS